MGKNYPPYSDYMKYYGEKLFTLCQLHEVLGEKKLSTIFRLHELLGGKNYLLHSEDMKYYGKKYALYSDYMKY